MGGDQLAAIGLGAFACALGVGGIVAAIARRRRRAEIAATYGSTGGVAFTIVQAGCAGLMVVGGLILIGLGLAIKR